jgi:stage V sporulation protein B
MVQNVIFQSFGRFYWGIMTLSVGIAVKLISNSYFVVMPEVNIMGAVLSMYLNYIIPFMINNILITRGLGIRMNLLRESLRPLAASAAMGGVLYLTNMLFTRFGAGYAITSILTLANIGIGMAVYFTALLLIGGLKKDEISEISPRLLRMIPEGIRNRMK